MSNIERPNVRRPPVLAGPDAVAHLAENVALDCVEHAGADADEVADRLESVAKEIRERSLHTGSGQS